jgi:hypothetical protein
MLINCHQRANGFRRVAADERKILDERFSIDNEPASEAGGRSADAGS